jgi:hypothetical protein
VNIKELALEPPLARKINFNTMIKLLASKMQQKEMRFVAFPVTEYDEVLSGYQPGQMVER